jgi:tRNA (guanine-N7-)-methyltransferase
MLYARAAGTMATDHQREGRPGAFFGRRQGHKLKPRQAALFDTMLPGLALDLTAAPGTLSHLFASPAEEVRLEIGFGGGEHLVAEAERNPHGGFIGVEPFVNGMAKILSAIEARRLTNIRLHFGDAVDVMAWLPPESLTRVDLIHPDPWPKRRHWKRRFVQDASLAEIIRLLRPAGEFRFVTDIPDYAAWTLERGLRTRELLWTAERADDWRRPWQDFGGTRYGAKASRAGRTACYLIFRKSGLG